MILCAEAKSSIYVGRESTGMATKAAVFPDLLLFRLQTSFHVFLGGIKFGSVNRPKCPANKNFVQIQVNPTVLLANDRILLRTPKGNVVLGGLFPLQWKRAQKSIYCFKPNEFDGRKIMVGEAFEHVLGSGTLRG